MWAIFPEQKYDKIIELDVASTTKFENSDIKIGMNCGTCMPGKIALLGK